MDPKRRENTLNMDISENKHNNSKIYENFKEFILNYGRRKSLNLSININ